MDGRLYVRNLFGGSYAPETLFTTFAADATLPPNAVDTGYWLGKTHLYASADGTSVYLASPLRVERWPRVRGDQVMPDPCP